MNNCWVLHVYLNYPVSAFIYYFYWLLKHIFSTIVFYISGKQRSLDPGSRTGSGHTRSPFGAGGSQVHPPAEDVSEEVLPPREPTPVPTTSIYMQVVEFLLEVKAMPVSHNGNNDYSLVMMPILNKYFFINWHICNHSKLEIVLAIPALNEWKIETNNSAGQGLKCIYII